MQTGTDIPAKRYGSALASVFLTGDSRPNDTSPIADARR